MAVNQINAGDVVQLKSGGPPMTVKEIISNEKNNPGRCVCTWFNFKDEHYALNEEASFTFTSLQLLPEEPSGVKSTDNDHLEKDVVLF